LQALDVRETSVADLSPLRSPALRDSLRELKLWRTKVTDFSPVAGCASLESLDAFGLPLEDLSILKGMKLRTLLIGSTEVTDISPLAGMPLEGLNFDPTSGKKPPPPPKMPTPEALGLPPAPNQNELLPGPPHLA